jgi:hypothetical protein
MNQAMAAHKLDYFLGTAPNLQALYLETKKLALLQKAWEKAAPSALVSASHVGALQNGALTVYVGNGAIAAKLKQQAPRLLGKLQEWVSEVTSIRFEVQVRNPETDTRHKDLVLSQAALASLQQLEESLDDTPLRDALHRLVKHHSGRD